MAYLATNPCCTDITLNTTCGCSSTTTAGCTCKTTQHYSKSIIYNGPILPCSSVQPCDDLNVALSKIDELLCALKTQQVTNTTSIATLKEQVILINQTLNTCCG